MGRLCLCGILQGFETRMEVIVATFRDIASGIVYRESYDDSAAGPIPSTGDSCSSSVKDRQKVTLKGE